MVPRHRDRDDDRSDRSLRERERPSWREIDAARDRPFQRRNSEERAQGSRPTAGYNRYKEELEALFSRGKVSETIRARLGDRARAVSAGGTKTARVEMLRRIRSAETTADRVQAVDEFLRAGHEPPDDLEVLVAVVDHPDETVVRQALLRIEGLLERQRLSRKASFVQRLALLADTAEDPETAAVARRLADRLR